MARSGQTSPRHYILTTNNTTITYDSPYLLLTSPWYGWPMYDAFSTLTSVPSTSGVRCVERSGPSIVSMAPHSNEIHSTTVSIVVRP